MSVGNEQDRAAHAVARQLGIALSAYRLFPDDLEQPGFASAVQRVGDAVTQALASGPLRFEIRSGVLGTPEGPLPTDAHLDRLAGACFERGIEHIQIFERPDADTLAVVCAVLTEPPDDGTLRRPEDVLADRGIRAIWLGRESPEAEQIDAVDRVPLTDEQRALWDQVRDPERTATNLMIEGLPDDAAEAARRLYQRFRTLHAVLPPVLAASEDLVGNVRAVIDLMRGEVRREFHAIVLSRLNEDTFADGFFTHLTDGEVADLLIELSRSGGPDPVALADQVTRDTGRHGTVTDLVRARADEDGAPYTAFAAGEVAQAAADRLSERLLPTQDEDAAYLRDMFPATESDHRALARLALHDYLQLESDVERLERVLQSWTERCRAALQERDAAEVDRLLALLDAPLAGAAGEGPRSIAERARDAVVGPELVSVLVGGERGDDESGQVVALLARFGRAALDAVLDQLAIERASGLRARLVAWAAEMPDPGAAAVISRLADERWFVVRNLLTILARSGDRAAYPALTRLVRHPEDQVRRELVRSLVACGGAEAVPELTRLALDDDVGVRTAAIGALGAMRETAAARALAAVVRDGEHVDERRRALELIAAHPAGAPLLAELGGRAGGTRLPRTLRKAAQELARGRGERR